MVSSPLSQGTGDRPPGPEIVPQTDQACFQESSYNQCESQSDCAIHFLHASKDRDRKHFDVFIAPNSASRTVYSDLIGLLGDFLSPPGSSIPRACLPYCIIVASFVAWLLNPWSSRLFPCFSTLGILLTRTTIVPRMQTSQGVTYNFWCATIIKNRTNKSINK